MSDWRGQRRLAGEGTCAIFDRLFGPTIRTSIACEKIASPLTTELDVWELVLVFAKALVAPIHVFELRNHLSRT